MDTAYPWRRRDADTRADVYGLGCTLFHLLVGRVPYPADTPLKKILAHREKPVPNGSRCACMTISPA
jgi:serine/threonine-protein kinase